MKPLGATRDGETDANARAAQLTVDRLRSQATALRAELIGLQHDVAQVRRDFSGMRAVQLLEAHEQLVIAALHAETIAETAACNLSTLAPTSQHDPLTDAPNRLLMLDRLVHAIALANRRGTQLAVLFVDLDHFKEINDTFGHAVGDRVLQQIVQRLKTVVRESDTVSRHGGDEFWRCWAKSPRHPMRAPAPARCGRRWRPSRIDGLSIRLHASIGIAVYPGDGEDAPTLIAHADAAMYRAKPQGRGGFAFHDPASSPNRIPHPRAGARPAAVQRRNDLPAGPDERLLRHLRQANEHLLVAAPAAQEEQAKAEAKQRRQARRLAAMAHELRSPMAPLRTAASLLKHPVKDEPLTAQLQTIIESQVDSMSDMVDAVHADASRLVQVFCDLLDNASKYTPMLGRIALTATVCGHDIVITVADSGLGIRADGLPGIFDLFAVRGRSAGLGRGSEFVVTLPVHR